MSSPQTTLGVHLLETITLGMYSEPLHCIREYVQNAYDSVRNARRTGSLASDGGCIDVLVDPDARTLRIRTMAPDLTPTRQRSDWWTSVILERPLRRQMRLATPASGG